MLTRTFVSCFVAVQVWACAALAIEPGEDFGIHVKWPLVVQKIVDETPSEVHFDVHGCERFSVAARIESDIPEHLRPTRPPTAPDVALEHVSDGHGGYTARVHVQDALDQQGFACFSVADAPVRGTLQLVLRCTGDGRNAVSNALPLVYAPADGAGWGFTGATQLEDTGDPNRWLAMRPGMLAVVRPERGNIAIQSVDLSQWPHSFMRIGTMGYLASACVFPHCTQREVVDPKTGARAVADASDIFELNLDAVAPTSGPSPEAKIVTRVLRAAGFVTHMQADADGSILILSQNGTMGSFQTILSRLSPSTGESETLWLAENEFPASNVGGDAVITEKPDGTFYLRSLHTSEALPLALPYVDMSSAYLGLQRAFQMAPDGRQWVYQGNGMVWLDGPGQEAQQLALDLQGSFLAAVAWLPTSFALHPYFSNELALFDRETPATRLKTITLDLRPDKSLAPTVARGEWFVVQAEHGIVVYDGRGERVAGTGLPEACREVHNRSPVLVGPRTLGWLSEGQIFKLDLP